MNIGIYNYYDSFNRNNRIFENSAYPLGENMGYPFILLKEWLEKKGHFMTTLDMHPINEFEKIVFLDYPDPKKVDLKKLSEQGIELYLVIFESELIKKDNWDKNNHIYFKKIFTWNDDWVDGEKYIHSKWPNKIPEELVVRDFSEKKLCTLIAGKKENNDARELYSERIRAIEWFEKNKPDDFDLYGMGWDMANFHRPFGRLNRFKKLRKLFAKKFKSYSGKVNSKKETLSKYKFCICYENAKEIPGYITEKIFDCLFSGCIPIYLGAPNISDYIPSNCYIDKNQYDSYDLLYDAIKNIDEKTYNEYIGNIDAFLKGEQMQIFSAETFADTIIKNLELL